MAKHRGWTSVFLLGCLLVSGGCAGQAREANAAADQVAAVSAMREAWQSGSFIWGKAMVERQIVFREGTKRVSLATLSDEVVNLEIFEGEGFSVARGVEQFSASETSIFMGFSHLIPVLDERIDEIQEQGLLVIVYMDTEGQAARVLDVVTLYAVSRGVTLYVTRPGARELRPEDEAMVVTTTDD